MSNGYSKRGKSYYFSRTRNGKTKSFGPYGNEDEVKAAMERIDAALPPVARPVKSEEQKLAELLAGN